MPTDLEALKAAAALAREGMGVKERSAEDEAAEDTSEKEVAEVESPEESEDEVEESEESEDEAEEEKSEEDDTQTHDKSVFRQLNEIRSQKREFERVAKEEKEKLLSEKKQLQDEVDAFKRDAPPSEAFVDFAKKQGIDDPKVVKEMYDLYAAQLKAEMAPQLDSLNKKLSDIQNWRQQNDDANAEGLSMKKFDGEWKDIVPLIEGDYKPTPTQLQQAKTLLVDLSHSQKYHDKDLDYILFRESSQFENILGSRKRKTMFSSKPGARIEEKKQIGLLPKSDGTHNSILELRKTLSRLKSRDELSDDTI